MGDFTSLSPVFLCHLIPDTVVRRDRFLGCTGSCSDPECGWGWQVSLALWLRGYQPLSAYSSSADCFTRILSLVALWAGRRFSSPDEKLQLCKQQRRKQEQELGGQEIQTVGWFVNEKKKQFASRLPLHGFCLLDFGAVVFFLRQVFSRLALNLLGSPG